VFDLDLNLSKDSGIESESAATSRPACFPFPASNPGEASTIMGVFRAQAEPYDDERRCCCGCWRHVRKHKCCWFLFVLWAVVGGFAIGALAWIAHDAKEPRYSAAIASVSGLDPARDLGRATLDPEFNLTLRIASRSHMRGACVDVGAALDVSYPASGSRAPRHRTSSPAAWGRRRWRRPSWRGAPRSACRGSCWMASPGT
jgi:hypothetical protein